MAPGAAANQVVSLDERRLLQRHQKGDSDAFGELVSLYRRSVYGYLVRCGVPSAHQEDLFQEIFLRVHHAAARYQPERALKPWLFTIVANVVRTHFRRAKVRRLVRADPSALETAPSAQPSGEELTQAQQTARWLEGALQKLPIVQREALILCALEKMSIQDAATALNTNPNTLKTNLRRARISLADQLRRKNKAEAKESQR